MTLSAFLHLCVVLLPWAIGVFYLGLWMLDAWRAAVLERRQ